jgi:hypothetical protein
MRFNRRPCVRALALARDKKSKNRLGSVVAQAACGSSAQSKRRNPMMTRVFFALAFILSAAIGCVSPVVAAPGQGVSEDTIAARERFFGAENVDAVSGQVRADRVIFSWVTNASLAVSIRGRIVLLDTYINRPELPPTAGAADLRRSPISIQELVALAPEAIFLGHGHGDHADNAAYIAKQLNIPIYASPETCDVMQADVQRMFADPNTVNGGARIIPNNLPVKCISPVTRGSVPGAEVVNIHQLDPVACIIAFKHIHSGTVPTDTTFPFIPVFPDSDPRELATNAGVPTFPAPGSPPLYPRLTSLTPSTPPVPGQMNLTTTGFGTIAGSPGGPISIFYQFITGDANNFTFVWHNTTGPLKEGAGSDPGLPSPAIGAKLFSIMDSLPQTDVELGSIVSLGVGTNGVRDPILYQQHIRPLVYIPIHETDATPIGSSLRFKNAYLKAVVAANVAVQPEIRWMVDPDDFVRPMVYDPKDDRWKKSNNQQTINKFCNH